MTGLYSLPFPVPENISSLTVSYQYPKASGKKDCPVNVIDLGLENDKGQFLGWSGSGRDHVTGKVHGVRLNLTCMGETFGSVISDCAASHTLHIEAKKMPVGSVLQLVGQNGLLAQFHPQKGKVCTDLEIRKTSFAYLLALYRFPGPEGYPLAVSNPIYFA